MVSVTMKEKTAIPANHLISQGIKLIRVGITYLKINDIISLSISIPLTYAMFAVFLQ